MLLYDFSSGTDYSAPFASPSGPGPYNDYGPSVGGGYGMGGGGSFAAGPQAPSSMMGGTFAGQNLLNDPMANMAMQYGHTLAGQGSEYMTKNVNANKY